MTIPPITREPGDAPATFAGRLRAATRPTDRDALLIWVASRASVWVIAAAVGWLFTSNGVVPLLDRWRQWDFHHFEGIAVHGYDGDPTGVPNEAFFPGLPRLLRLGDALGFSPVAAGLVVSLVAGAVAAVALARLGDLEGGPGTGRLAVMAWAFAPPAIFLAAPYTESLFLGLAVPAWLCARRGRWAYAGLLAAAACTVRVSGMFLAVALGVEWLTSRQGRHWTDLPWLLTPIVPMAAWTIFLRVTTGDWLAWLHAQAEEWNREFTWPWTALAHTWNAGFCRDSSSLCLGDGLGGPQSPGFAWMFRAEIVAMVIGIALTAALLVWRRWGDATWVGLQVIAFGTSFWYFSVPRATLLWWPLWIALAALAVRRRWVLWAYLSLSVPLMALWSAAYLTGRWAG
ncbi:MAG: mannosyltransferase family protein [Jiangellaceae bacterium]